MGLMSAFVKAGLAKKAVEQARKPANQARARELFRSMTSKGKGTGRSSTPPPGTPRY